MFVGRAAKEPEVVTFDDGKKVVNITIAVARSFKNSKGEIETDFFNVAFWDFLVDFVVDNVKVGNVIFVKGRVQTTPNTLANGYVLQTPSLIGERLVTFPQNGHQQTAQKKEDE